MFNRKKIWIPLFLVFIGSMDFRNNSGTRVLSKSTFLMKIKNCGNPYFLMTAALIQLLLFWWVKPDADTGFQ